MASTLNTRLLLVDDDPKLCRLVREYLEPMGYSVSTAQNGVDGLEMALAGDFEAVILDVMLPRLDGFEVLKALRARSNVPVLMLTGLGDEADRIVGLEIGADDYLPKTFSTRELLARLRAVIRRSRFTAANRTAKLADEREPAVIVGDLRVDPASREAILGELPVTLTTVEFDLLIALARATGRVKTREMLLLEVAERDFEAFDRSIDVHISSIRRKLGDDPKSPQYIQTIRGIGYMMLKPGTVAEA
jgi:DNA-binding response OmpR family regulator